MGRPKAWHQHSAFAWPILAFRNLAGLEPGGAARAEGDKGVGMALVELVAGAIGELRRLRLVDVVRLLVLRGIKRGAAVAELRNPRRNRSHFRDASH